VLTKEREAGNENTETIGAFLTNNLGGEMGSLFIGLDGTYSVNPITVFPRLKHVQSINFTGDISVESTAKNPFKKLLQST